MTLTENEKAIALRERLKEIKDTDVPVISRDRGIPRKELAKLARGLFKSLGIKGVSVTTPSYSMASAVDVTLPAVKITDADLVLDGKDYRHESYADMPADVPAKMIREEHRKSVLAIEEILARAFPRHDDRSDSLTDYFDYKWSIS